MVYLTTGQENVSVNTPITFTESKGELTVVPTNTIVLSKCGSYGIFVQASVSNNTSATATVGIQIYENGVPVTNATSQSISAGATSWVSLSIPYVTTVKKSCQCVDNTKRIQVVITGVNAVVSSAQVLVERV